MPFSPNHSSNLPREFSQCDRCGKRGVYRYGGTAMRSKTTGKLTGLPPGRRCKYCSYRTTDLTQEAYEISLNSDRPNLRPRLDIREKAIRYTMSVLRRATDWQDGQHALADHAEFGPWLERGGNPLGDSQSIIREAEERLGDQLPY